MYNDDSSMEDHPAIRARVPANVAGGQMSTGVIVASGQNEFLLDFVRNLPRPPCLVARIVLPHPVVPQFISALDRNIEIYEKHFGLLPGFNPRRKKRDGSVPRPQGPPPAINQIDVFGGMDAEQNKPPAANDVLNAKPAEQSSNESIEDHLGGSADGLSPAGDTDQREGKRVGENANSSGEEQQPPPYDDPPEFQPRGPQQGPTPQEIYDELKMSDHLLSGVYANAVMIGHGQFEFSFDFITNFFPQSAVSSRVFMAAGHVGRLADSLKTSWKQFLRSQSGGGSFE